MTQPPRTGDAAAGAHDDCTELLFERLGAALAEGDEPAATSLLRERLLQRARGAVRAEAAFHTVRGRRDWFSVDPGVRCRWLYQAAPGEALRLGEPLRARLMMLAPGAAGVLRWPQRGMRSEWLVMTGDVDVDDVALATRDYHVTVSSHAVAALRSAGGALLYLREAPAAGDEAAVHTARDKDLPWFPHAPGIERRVVWQSGSEAAMLYRVQPGGSVPCHGHGHDEECLMIEGDVFVDDLLLRAGDYQLAPAGTTHQGVCSDTGGILFGHGDIDLAVTPR